MRPMRGGTDAGRADLRGLRIGAGSVRLGVEPMRSATGVLRRPRPGVRGAASRTTAGSGVRRGPTGGPIRSRGLTGAPGSLRRSRPAAPRPGRSGPRSPAGAHAPPAAPARPPSAGSRVEAADHPMQIVLVRQDGGDGTSWSVWPGSVVTIGRHQGQLTFPHDAFISDPHARCRRIGGSLEIADMNSRNGIFVRVRGRVNVFPGDAFLLGHHLLRLENAPPARVSLPPGEAEGSVRPAARPGDGSSSSRWGDRL